MYKIGDMLMHPGSGVCRVEDIKNMSFTSEGSKDYYVLKPVYGGGSTTIYVPVDHKNIKLRKLLSEEDIHRLIGSVSSVPTLWTDNDAKRKEVFSQALHSGDSAEIIKLIIEIHKKQEEKQASGKKLHQADSKVLAEAEMLIHQEFAYALDLKPEEVAPFIMKEMNITN